MTMILSSAAFSNGADIPTRHTCDGTDISPPLLFTGVPANTRSLALIVDDPDAPDPAAPRMVWVHWVLFNIAPTVTEIPAGKVPKGAREGLNDWKEQGYRGPCPPVGRHRYFFKLYALDCMLPDMDRPGKAQVEKAMQGHVLEQSELLGLYQR